MISLTEELADFKAEFVREAEVRLQTIDGLLDRLQGQPDDSTALAQLHLQFHSFSGTGGLFGFPRVTELGRKAESRCLAISDGGQTLTPMDLVSWRELSRMIAVELAEDSEPPPAVVPDRSAEALKVLIVEEDEETRWMLAHLLEEEGFAAHAVRTRAEANRYLESRLPDGLIASTSLPDGSGYELVEQVRESPNGQGTAIVLIGPRDDRIDKVEAIGCGADGCFDRPIDFSSLMRRMHHLLQRRAAQAGRVLYMEDDPAQAAAVRAILESAGYDVRCCELPERFASELAAFNPDLVLMDIMLPGMSGFDLVKALRQDERNATLPVLFLTTQGQLQARIETARAGGDDHLEKPVPPPLLLSAVAARVERSRFLRSLLNQDGLTRLLTHTAFVERARAAVNERRCDSQSKPVWVMIDIDHFKSINDRHGHPVGDRVLVSLSALFRRHLRGTDTVGRYGGEEFAIVLDGVSEEDAWRIVERLRSRFEAIRHQALGGAEFSATFSAGISVLRPVMDLESWRYAADQALYAAKAAGRNRVEVAPEPQVLKVA
jgi:diguanylate cyclase (GGDEF)-like protein